MASSDTKRRSRFINFMKRDNCVKTQFSSITATTINESGGEAGDVKLAPVGAGTDEPKTPTLPAKMWPRYSEQKDAACYCRMLCDPNTSPQSWESDAWTLARLINSRCPPLEQCLIYIREVIK